MRSRQPRAITEHFPNRSANDRSTQQTDVRSRGPHVRVRATFGLNPLQQKNNQSVNDLVCSDRQGWRHGKLWMGIANCALLVNLASQKEARP